MKTTRILLVIVLTAAVISILFPIHTTAFRCVAWSVIVPLILSLASTVYSGVSQSSSQKKSAAEMDRQQKELEKRRSDYDAWFKGEYNQDFYDTDIAQSSMRNMGTVLKNTLENNKTGAIRTGATPETQVAQQGQAQQILADTINKLTGAGTQYKQNLRNSYDYRIQNYLQPLDQLSMARVANYTNLGAQTGDSMQGLNTSLAGVDWEALLGGAG